VRARVRGVGFLDFLRRRATDEPSGGVGGTPGQEQAARAEGEKVDLGEARIDTGTPDETRLPPDQEAADDVGRPPRSQ
jgi:hypothetical protein